MNYPICLIAAALSLTPMVASSARSDEQNFAAMLGGRDPLSCFVQKSDEKLCDGRAGAWQLARLSVSVEATAKALEIAGIGFKSDILQSAIYRDAGKFGFDASLVAPTVALFDLASSANSPFGDKSADVQGLAALSLESLYPGAMKSLDRDISALPGITASNGILSFGDFATIPVGASSGPRSVSEFMNYGHKELDGSTPALDVSPDGGLGLSPSTFSIAAAAAAGLPTPSGVFEGSPLALGFTNHSYAERGVEGAPTPLQGIACSICGGTAEELSLMAGSFDASAGPGEAGGMSGDGMMDMFANSTQQTAQNGGAVGSCMSTCPDSQPEFKAANALDKAGVRNEATGILMMAGSAATLPESGAGGVLGILAGYKTYKDGNTQREQADVERAKGIEACQQKCTPVDEPKTNGEEATPTAAPGNEEPKKNDETQPTTQGSGDQMAIQGGVDEPDATPPEQPTKGDTVTLAGGGSCQAMMFVGRSFCDEPQYAGADPICTGNDLGEVNCGGPNTLITSNTVYVAEEFGDGSLTELKLGGRQFLLGDVSQMTQLRKVGGPSLDIEKFTPVRGGLVNVDYSLLAAAQTPASASAIGNIEDEPLTVPPQPNVDVQPPFLNNGNTPAPGRPPISPVTTGPGLQPCLESFCQEPGIDILTLPPDIDVINPVSP